MVLLGSASPFANYLPKHGQQEKIESKSKNNVSKWCGASGGVGWGLVGVVWRIRGLNDVVFLLFSIKK